MPDNYRLIGWPTLNEITFAVVLDSAQVGCQSEYLTDNVYLFCFKNRAFGITHFEWDGDAEEGDWAETYSIRSYRPEALAWSYIKKMIVDKVTAMELQVPKLVD